MPPGGGGDQVFGEQDNPPATGHGCRDEEAPSRSRMPSPPPPPLLPGLAVTPVASQNKKMRLDDEQQGEEDTPASFFPEDVLVEILSRVPYISLFHFKCVSKQWLALCSDPDAESSS